MAEFQELIKNFDRIRDYMRSFFLYGFKVRSDFQGKSGRTYDNERRRIENYLSGYIQADYTCKGKQVSIRVDSKRLQSNPLYAAWKSRSFTDNDLLFHFFLLDILSDNSAWTVSGLCDQIAARYGEVTDVQTLRLKCREYATLGILSWEKDGKSVVYRLASPLFEEKDPLYPALMHAVKFCSEALPFGIVGSTLLDREFLKNDLFSFKHYFLVHTLEDQELLHILKAMEEHRFITFLNSSVRSGNKTELWGLPLKIFVSTQTGRRYLCLYFPPKRRFNCLRLDCISKVKPLEICGDYPMFHQKLDQSLSRLWGVSFGGASRMEILCMKLHIREDTEGYILNRLHREGRGGEVLRVCADVFLYTGVFFDTNEMLGWVKSFTGRILDLQCSNPAALKKVTEDLERMYRMYAGYAEAEAE